MNSNVLYVPVMMEALVVGRDSDSLADLAPDYSKLSDLPLGKYTTRLFGTVHELAGVHLHWTMPDALLQGIQQTNDRDEDHLEFPYLPNRWIVQRTATKSGKIDRKCWMIESDFITNNPDTDKGGRHRVTIPTFRLKDGLWNGAGLNGEIFGYLGNARDYGSPLEENGYYLPKLDALGMGDPAFAAFYPKCRSVFGFYDSMKDVDSGSFTYSLAGYYSNPENDPLCDATIETLEALNWTVEQMDTLPSQTVCHSMIQEVDWRGENYTYPSGVPDAPVEVYIGNTSAEALSKVIQNRMPDVKGLERMLNALQNDLLGDLDNAGEPDAPILMEESLHEKQFSSEEQGIHWQLRNSGDSGVEALMDGDEYDLLESINDFQLQNDIDRHEIASLKNEIYFAWWKYMLINSDPWANHSDSHPALLRDKELSKSASAEEFEDIIENLIAQLKEKQEDIVTNTENLKNKKAELEKILGKKNLTLSHVTKERFYSPNDPALMLVGDGVKRAFKQGFQCDESDGTLHCRQFLLTDVHMLIENETVVLSGYEAESLCSALKMPLPDRVQDLFQESLLLSSDCADALAMKAVEKTGISYSTERFKKIISDLKKQQQDVQGFTGSKPGTLAFTCWKQPWVPFMLEWQVSIVPSRTQVETDDAFSSFRLDVIDLEPAEKRGAFSSAESVEIQGSTLLSPHAVVNFANMTKRLMQDAGDSSEDYTPLEETLKILEKTDILSQRMDGFNEAFIMRDLVPSIPLYDKNELTKELRTTLTNLLDQTFISPRVDDVAERFIPVRAGQIALAELWLIDAFGQVKKIHLSLGNQFFAENMAQQDMSAKGILRPRFIQPCTTRFKWQKAANSLRPLDASKPQKEDMASPIFGFVVSNFLDKNLQVYDYSGNLLGLVQKSGDGAEWKKPFSSCIELKHIVNPHLKLFANQLTGENNQALTDLLMYLDEMFNDAATFGNDQFMQFCFGRPLALAGATLEVAGKGEAPHIQWFKTELSCNGCDSEAFSVRIGDKRKLFDGLFGFYKGEPSKKAFSHLYTKKNGRCGSSGYIVPDNTLETTLKSKPVRLTLLFDPTTDITVTTGFLPAAKIRLDAKFYQKQLENNDMMLRVAPLLSEAGHVEAPLPGAMENTWSFIHQNPDHSKSIDKLNQPESKFPQTREQILEGFIKTEFNRRKNRIEMDNTNYDVAYGASPSNLTTDEICRFDFYISNDSAAPIVFNNEKELKPEDYPAYDDPVLEGSPSGFYVYFKYGDKNSDLVETADSVNIHFSIKLGDHWNIFQSVSPTIGQYWRICPKETTVMEPGDQLSVAVENVKCNRVFGMTALFVELRTEGSIFKDRLNLFKYDKPEIKSFRIKETDYDIGDMVTFQWCLDKADGCEVTLDGKNVSGKEEQLLEIENKHYVLEVKNPAFYSVTATCSPNFIFIESFGVSDYYPKSITLQWATRNSSYCEIEGIGKVEPVGTMTVPSDSETIKSYCFTFILHPKGSTDLEIKKIEFGYPVITNFCLDDQYNQIRKMADIDTLEMNPDQPFVSILEIDKHMTVASVCRPYDAHPDPEPHYPSWHYGLRWTGTDVVEYDLVEHGHYDGKDRRIERNKDERHFKLIAFGLNGIAYDERTI